MEDTNPERVNQNSLDQSSGTESPQLKEGSSSVLLQAIFGDEIPAGPLGPDTVPTTVLALPVAIATEALVRHAKQCKNVECPHVPPSLRVYRRMRPEAIRKAGDQVHKALWATPDHELVAWVRKQVLEEYPEIVKDVGTGSLLQGDKLGATLRDLGSEGARIVASVLWATEFEGPQAENLFRSLVPLAKNGFSRRTGEPRRHDDKQAKELSAELRRISRELKESKGALDRAKHDVEVRERLTEKFRKEFEEVRAKNASVNAEVAQLRDIIALLRDANQTLEKEAEKSSKVNLELRRDLRRLQDAQKSGDVERSEFACEIAALRRSEEHLKLALASAPTGAAAVVEFLRAEESRIQKDRIIKSGGAKVHADEEWTTYRKLEKAFLEAHPEYKTPPPKKIRPKVSLRMRALGGSAEVGRSAYLIELGEHPILVDCGIKPGSVEDLHPEIESIERLDALVLTHAHTDHIGWVPALIRRFPELDIYCSEGTAALLPVMLQDCRQHYARKLATMQERAPYIRNAEPIVEAYDEDDMRAVSTLAINCRFGEKETLPFGDASISFYKAGHILGAASVLIEDQSGRRVFLSGDFSSFPQLTVGEAKWPEDLDVDLLVLESTYGDKEHHRPAPESRAELISFVQQTVHDRRGSVILASFGLGRAQELLKTIGTAREAGELPISVPVFVDGMIKQINPIYRKHADFQFSDDGFNEVVGDTERDETAITAQQTPSIIVTTSGMLTGGPVVEYARRLLPDPRHRIVLTGYQDEGAPSKALRELATPGGGPRRVDLINQAGEPIRFEAAMPAKEIGLSAHADRAGLVAYAARLRPTVLALVHGEPRAQKELQFRLSQVHKKADIITGPAELVVP